MKELGEKHLPEVLTKLEGKAAKNNAERGWIVGNNVSILRSRQAHEV